MLENELLAVCLCTKIMILQKFEALIDLDSLKMTPFADFRVENQTLICHTSISLAEVVTALS